MRGQKHLVSCRCILHQLKNAKNPQTHKFVVFSLIDDEDRVVSKYVQCNNCGIVHRVSELCTSQIVGSKEDLKTQLTIEDIKRSIDVKLASYLDGIEADRATYEMCKFVSDNKLWGTPIVLTTENVEDSRQGKIVRIMSENFFIIDEFTASNIVSPE